jgi:hypothetical protein
MDKPFSGQVEIRGPREPVFQISPELQNSSLSVMDVARAGKNTIAMGGNALRWGLEHPVEGGLLAALGAGAISGLTRRAGLQNQKAAATTSSLLPWIDGGATVGAWGTRLAGPNMGKYQSFFGALPHYARGEEFIAQGDWRHGTQELTIGAAKGKVMEFANGVLRPLDHVPLVGRALYTAGMTIASPVAEGVGQLAGKAEGFFFDRLFGNGSSASLPNSVYDVLHDPSRSDQRLSSRFAMDWRAPGNTPFPTPLSSSMEFSPAPKESFVSRVRTGREGLVR